MYLKIKDEKKHFVTELADDNKWKRRLRKRKRNIIETMNPQTRFVLFKCTFSTFQISLNKIKIFYRTANMLERPLVG